MRRLLALLALLSPSALFAADPPATLPAKDLADGWVMLFDGESLFGWTPTGKVEVKDGALILPEETSVAAFQVHLPAGELRVDGRETAHAEGPLSVHGPGQVKEVLYRPADPKPIFTGKDLSGWKVFDDPKRNKSKVEVTKGGEIRLTNGPGDLQTEAKYADFALQLEFKTNGDGLNSGVFFRCIPNQYQNGYECQINNAAKNGDRNTPADGGTGGIYRRQPARKIVADDRTWTHLTLVARGPTFATWVNGYPVCLWTDDRPKDENPRKGQRLEAGHLSIQGHDPTTDLLFRNLRLAEYRK